ncbi:MAG: hypothetical protein R2688_01005 [Fimbriimonadaceae bacterium]
MAYDSAGRLSGVSDVASSVVLMLVAYDGSGLIQSVSDCYGRTVYFRRAIVVVNGLQGYLLTGRSQVVASTVSELNAPNLATYSYTGVSGVSESPPSEWRFNCEPNGDGDVYEPNCLGV